MELIELLHTFAALSLCGSVLLHLLPGGGLRRTAGMAMGLLTLLCWLKGLLSLLPEDFASPLPDTALTHSAATVEAAQSVILEAWEEGK